MNYKQFVYLRENEEDKNKEYYFIQLNILEFLKFLNNEEIKIDKFYSLEKNDKPLNVSLDIPVFIYLSDLSKLFKDTTNNNPIETTEGEEPTPSYDKDIPNNQPVTINFLKDVISSIEVDKRFYPIVSHTLNKDEISKEVIIEYLQIPKDKTTSREEIQEVIKTFIENKLEQYPFNATFS